MRCLAGQAVVCAVPAGGAMYVMLDVRATGLSGEAFAARLLDAERIAVMPGESFGSAAAGHLRVALTIPDDAFEAAFARLLAFAGRIAGMDARTPAEAGARNG
jgi:arginine:pyruvate transaminase